MAEKSIEYYSKTLEKGLKLLDLFDENHSHWSQKDIAETMCLNTTSTYRLINTFVEMGYLLKDTKTKQLSLGPMAVALGHRLLRSYDLRKIVWPIIEKASQQYGVSIDVALFVHNAMVIVCRCEQANTLTFHQPVSAQELYCTAIGKAFLAHLHQPELDEIVSRQSFRERTSSTIVDRERLILQLKETRNRGYSVNNEEYIKGLISIGAPVFNPISGAVMGGVSFDSTTVETSLPDFEDSYSAPLIELAQQITTLLPGS